VEIERRREGRRERVGMTEVIAMVMRSDDAVELARTKLDPELTQPRGCDLGTNPRLDEDACAAGLHEQGIPARSAPEHEDTHGCLHRKAGARSQARKPRTKKK
jgi:hypothetical protein